MTPAPAGSRHAEPLLDGWAFAPLELPADSSVQEVTAAGSPSRTRGMPWTVRPAGSTAAAALRMLVGSREGSRVVGRGSNSRG